MNKTTVYERLSSGDVLRLLTCSRESSTVYYFETTRLAKILISLFSMSNKIVPIEFSYADAKNENGEHLYFEIHSKHILEICNLIADHQMQTNSLINKMVKMFGRKNYILYYKKFISHEVAAIIHCLMIIVWLRDFKKQFGNDKITFVAKPLYCSVLKSYFQDRFDIDTKISGKSVYALQTISLFMRQLVIAGGMTIFPLLAISLKFLLRQKRHLFDKPMIGVPYSGTGITFNLKERCAFPFLLWDKLPFDRIIMIFGRTDVPIDDSGMKLLKEKKITLLSYVVSRHFTKYMPIYLPSLRQSRLIIKCIMNIISGCVSEICRNGSQGFITVNSVLKFIVLYARAYDFYENCNIKVVIDRNDVGLTSIPEHCALSVLGGIRVSFQISNFIMPDVVLATGADVMFTFGPYYNKTFIDSGSTNKVFLSSGYVTDYAIYSVRDNSKNIRSNIEKNGARFIACYLDENSSDDRWSIIRNKTSMSVYKGLLDIVIRDETFGLICSPKRPNDLLKRMPELKNVMEHAKQTGRCVFMDGIHRTRYYPTEPAQAADLSIVLLLGGTAGLECLLSGVRTVYLDLEGCNSYPEYLQDYNKNVFTGIESLVYGISEYRKNISGTDLIENRTLVPFLDEREPFRDGKASERIAFFLKGLLTAYEHDITQNEVLQQNVQHYINQYGNKVVQYNNL
jgi:hypothetical protein